MSREPGGGKDGSRMKSAEELRTILERIDHRGYPAYKDTKGEYRFPRYVLSIDHVQGDPFAAPSKVSLHIPGSVAGFPASLYEEKHRRIMLQDCLLRQFAKQIDSFSFKAHGSGKSGLMSVSRCGQEILERSACRISVTDGGIEVRMEIGFPANGRTVNAGELRKILFEYLPVCVEKSFLYRAWKPEVLERNAWLADDQSAIRQEMKRLGLVVFVADGSVLPRESGISQRPMKNAVLFASPESLAVELTLPHKGKLRGMGIPHGVTMIAGGGYHGKSTLLEAIERGVYDHIAGDGREYVMTEESAVKIRAEDGRSIRNVDISMFITNLPGGKDTHAFYSEDASGSTSQAANVVEACEAGSRLLLIDEDTSATNFMVRDELMQRVISRDKEPIIPFLERVRPLYEEQGISTILVAGSSGSFFHKADCIIQMDQYLPLDITAYAKQEAQAFPIPELPALSCVMPSFHRTVRENRRLFSDERLKVKTLGREGLLLQKETVDLRYVEQLADTEQINALGCMLLYAGKQLFDGKRTLQEVVALLYRILEEKGPDALGGRACGSFAMPRKQEVYACFNRCRSLQI